MKKTKIVTSIGPVSSNFNTFKKMVDEGANVARINFSHATIEERQKAVEVVKEVRKKTGKNIAILYDTKGPEFRNGKTKEEGIKLIPGNTIKIVKEDVVGTEEKFTVNHKNAIDSLNVGNIILLENGLMKLKVIEKGKDELTCKIITGGTLFSKKSLSTPGVKLDIPFISEKDREDIIYACKNDGDYLAASFVESAENIKEIKEILKQENRTDMKIIAKIESKTGIENLESICMEADGLMVARGDLGVEIPMEDLPVFQKQIVAMCRKNQKICIVATEMLESMKTNPRPTRAEVTDVANAVYNGTDAVMLSGETTTGNFPVETVKYMASICKHTESSINYKNIYADKEVENSTLAIIKSVAEAANSLDAKLIVVPTLSGASARLISNLEPKCPILALVSNEHEANMLSLNYGVYAKVVDFWNNMDEIFTESIKEAKKFMPLKKGDSIIVTGGFEPQTEETVPTNLMKIETIS